ncbi:conserved protein, unknown function [Hepatocystis sp. ex Piliocolobus tephrosceles]|nr:conserved protein, unknown function [Hepatocystis sp. ex Piliocolobus tephrosceles]
MLKYVIYGISGSISGWVLRDVVVCFVNNLNCTNGMLLNKFVCSKDDFFKNIFNELKYCFDPLEMKNGFNNFHIYTKQSDYFMETLYIENWNNISDMNKYIYSHENKKKLNYLKNMNIYFSPILFVLLKRYSITDTPNYLKKII